MQTIEHTLTTQDFHGFKQRRGHLASRHCHANRTKSNTRLDIHAFNDELAQRVLKSLGCEGAVVVFNEVDRRVQNLRSVFLELRYGLLIQLKRVILREEEPSIPGASPSN